MPNIHQKVTLHILVLQAQEVDLKTPNAQLGNKSNIDNSNTKDSNKIIEFGTYYYYISFVKPHSKTDKKLLQSAIKTSVRNAST